MSNNSMVKYEIPGHTVTIPAGLADGTYDIGATVDADNVISESNEGNNTAWDSFQVQTALDEYDLVADSLTPQSASVEAGGNVVVNWFGHLSGAGTGTLMISCPQVESILISSATRPTLHRSTAQRPPLVP